MLQIAEIPAGARVGGCPGPACTLALLAPGDRAVVLRVEGSVRLKRRLLEMGFVSGSPVRVVRFAPLGDPIEVELSGYHLSLRRAEAGAIRVHRSV